MAKIAIMGAMPEEIEPIIATLHDLKQLNMQPILIMKEDIKDKKLLLHIQRLEKYSLHLQQLYL